MKGGTDQDRARARPLRSDTCKCGLHGQCVLENCGCRCHVDPPLVRRGSGLQVPREKEEPPSASNAIGGGPG